MRSFDCAANEPPTCLLRPFRAGSVGSATRALPGAGLLTTPSGLGNTCAFGGWLVIARRSARSTKFIAAASKTCFVKASSSHGIKSPIHDRD
jgi:hypothetical protein